MYFLGIDTSCYTTSVAITDEEGRILEDRRTLLKVPEGKKGLRQSEMIFQHIQNLNEMFPEGYSGFSAVASSVTPTPEKGSYMPVFNVARTLGKVTANTNGAFFYPLTHQTGHIGAALKGNEDLKGRLLCFHVSGGTTELLEAVVGSGIVESIKPVTSTTDIAAGQLIDRIGVKMGTGFPAGQYISRLAETGRAEDISFRYDFEKISFSGAENQLTDMLADRDKQDVAATMLKHVAKILFKTATEARKRTGIDCVLFFGGVMRSSFIRQYLEEKLKGSRFAMTDYSSDNAVGLALQARNIYMRDEYGTADRR